MDTDYCKNEMARNYINELPYDQWVYICDLPESISFEIIDLIDTHKAEYKTVFCETFEKFLVTRCIPEIATLNLDRYYVKPLKKHQFTSNYKGVHYDKKAKRFIAQIKNKGKGVYLGSFKIEKHAAIAYQIAEINKRTFNPQE